MLETNTHYFFFKHQFGQWTQRLMSDRLGMSYNCCEQYMMYHKAKLFLDEEVASKIMSTDDPHEQKKLGRMVKNYNEDIWSRHRFQIVFEGNYLKFTQHKDLQERLLTTGNKILVEASPYDKIWGIGLGCDNHMINDEKNWKGLNLLGKVLMSVRSTINIGYTGHAY